MKLLATLSLVLVAACSKSTPLVQQPDEPPEPLLRITPTPNATSAPTGAVAEGATTSKPTEQAPNACALKQFDWNNHTFAVSEWAETPLVMLNGKAIKPGTDPAEQVQYRLAQVIYGDLSGDGVAEAVVEIEAPPFVGGNAIAPSKQLVFGNTPGCQPEFLGETPWGVHFKIDGGKLALKYPVPREGEPRCCPTGTKVIEYALESTGLVKVRDEEY